MLATGGFPGARNASRGSKMSLQRRVVLLCGVGLVALNWAPGAGGQVASTAPALTSASKPALDPVLSYSTYLGDDPAGAPAAAWDNLGNACIVFDTVLQKLNSDGSLIYSKGSFGGAQAFGQAAAIDSQGNCYVAGTGTITPTAGAFQASAPSGQFVMKFGTAGAVVYATYLGGSGKDTPSGLAVDPFGNAYLVGSTLSNDFPTAHPFQMAFAGGNGDAFVAALNANGSGLVYSTYLGGGGQDEAVSIAVDSVGSAYLTGVTSSSDFPTRAPFQPNLTGTQDGFVVKLDSAGSPVYSTFLGGAVGSAAIAVDSTGNAYLTGLAVTGFPLVNPLPGTSGPAFIAKLNPSGSALLFSTYFGAGLEATAIAVDSAGQIYITGFVQRSTTPPFPHLPLVSPIQSDQNFFLTDGFVSVLDASGTSVLFSTFLGGGPSVNRFQSIGVDSGGNIYASGIGSEPFPILNMNGPFEPFPLCSTSCIFNRAIALKIAPLSATVLAFPTQVDFQREPRAVGTSSDAASVLLANASSSGNIAIGGFAIVGDYEQTNDCPQVLLAATNCVLNITFTPTAGGTRTGKITITDDSPGSPHVMNLTGIGLVPQANLAPTMLSFASQLIATSSPAETVTLTNPGGATLDITQVSVSGDFAETNDCGISIGPSASCHVIVTFIPTIAGVRSGSLTVSDNAAPSPQTVSLSGIGVNPGLGLVVPLGGSSSATVSAGQTASYTLSIGGAGMSTMASLSCTGAPKGASCSVPASESVSATAPATINLSVTTTPRTAASIPSTARPAWTSGLWLGPIAVLGIMFLSGARTPKGPVVRYLGPAPLLLLAFLGSCGGGSSPGGSGSNPNGTPAGIYTLHVVAASSSGTETVPLTLTVQ
jgi:beta-propeller repeat-containing protein/HYDIN/CFA65/VesB family protein